MIHYINYITLSFISLFFSFIPRYIKIFIGKYLGSFMYYILPIRKKVAEINIKIAFPDFNKSQINRMVLKSYQHYGILLIEFLSQKKNNIYNFLNPIDEITKKHLLDNNGHILMTAHIGNWELMVPIISKYKKIMGVAREQKNSGADKFIKENRSFKNVTLITNKDSAKKMVSALLQKELLFLVCDQNAKSKGNKINFFNKKSSFPKGPGHFYYLTKCKLLYGFCILKKDYKYELIIRELNIKNNIEQKEEIIIEINRLYVEILEDVIKKYPEQYFWFHKKWDKDIYNN
jgi:KDO2-lipid IV(A) lauroyltransferase